MIAQIVEGAQETIQSKCLLNTILRNIIKNSKSRGTWVAQSVERWTILTQVMIPRLWDWAPLSGSVLGLEPVWDSLSLSLAAPLPLPLSPALSVTHTHLLNAYYLLIVVKRQDGRVVKCYILVQDWVQNPALSLTSFVTLCLRSHLSNGNSNSIDQTCPLE